MNAFHELLKIYEGSDGAATKALYDRLSKLGPLGLVAMNAFRACKNSERAKIYRGGNQQGSYRAQAYERKEWAIANLAAILSQHAQALEIRWGWQIDEEQELHKDVLYVDLPTGQISFHTSGRGTGPDYPGAWDRCPGTAPSRICRWCSGLLSAKVAA